MFHFRLSAPAEFLYELSQSKFWLLIMCTDTISIYQALHFKILLWKCSSNKILVLLVLWATKFGYFNFSPVGFCRKDLQKPRSIDSTRLLPILLARAWISKNFQFLYLGCRHVAPNHTSSKAPKLSVFRIGKLCLLKFLTKAQISRILVLRTKPTNFGPRRVGHNFGSRCFISAEL